MARHKLTIFSERVVCHHHRVQLYNNSIIVYVITYVWSMYVLENPFVTCGEFGGFNP